MPEPALAVDGWRAARAALAWSLAMALLLGVPLALTAACAIAMLVLTFGAQARRMSTVAASELAPTGLQALRAPRSGARAEPRHESAVSFLGHGGSWLPQHSQQLHHSGDPEAAFARSPARQPTPAPVWVATPLLSRNLLALGAPGSGKSSLLVLLAWQAQQRGEAILVLDPKGSQGLRALLAAGARAAGRPFLSLTPARPQDSARYDPLHYCDDAAAFADRLCGLIAGDRQDPFRSYCWGAVSTLAEALLVRGERPTLLRLRALVAEGGSSLAGSAGTPGSGIPAGRFAAAQAAVRQLAEHDRTHFRKMTAALLPVLEVLTSGDVAALLAPAQQPDELRPRLDLRHLRGQASTVYVGLDALASPQRAQVLAHLLLEDIAQQASRICGRAHSEGPLHVMVDEAGEVACPPLLQLLGKGREAGVQLLLAVQTLADLEWRLGSAAAARVAEGNAGAWFLFRQMDACSREESAARLGDFPLARETAASGRSESHSLGRLRHATSTALTSTRVPAARVPPALLSVLRDLECFAQLPDGQLLHLRLPRPTCT
jgi:conjugal transfer pilus assembly protein TraD